MNPQSRWEQKLAPFSSKKNQNRKDLQKKRSKKNAHINWRGGGGGLEVTCIQLALQAKFAAAKSSSRSSSDSPKNKKKENMKIPVILARNSVYDCKEM
jgi:hypothetical protein